MHTFEELRLRAFAARNHIGLPSDAPDIRVKRLARGLQSSVALVSSATPGSAHALQSARPFIVKHVVGSHRREIAVYETLQGQGVDVLPRLLGAEHIDAEQSYIYLEYVRRACSWPWHDGACAEQVMRTLAHVHKREHVILLPPWNYEAELRASGAATLELVEDAARRRCIWLRPALRHLRTVVKVLPEMRRALLARDSVAIHGDVHPGNLHVSRSGGRNRIVLLDWARARAGSGLEDVSSWLQSLGHSEQLARQRHDTLLKAYLEARGAEARLTADVRTQYWFAGASNALAGALRYHVWVADPAGGWSVRRQASARYAVLDWLRVIRRAAKYWQALQ